MKHWIYFWPSCLDNRHVMVTPKHKLDFSITQGKRYGFVIETTYMIYNRTKEDNTVTLEEDSENFLLASAVEVAKTCEPQELSVTSPV